MFRDLKEYQQIHNLYQNSVYLSEDERKFIETVNETEFTDEELLYFSENTEEVINHLIESEILNENIFKLGGLVKGIKNVKGLKNVSKIKGFDKFKNIKVPSKNVKNIKLPSKGYELQSIGGFKGFKDSPVTSITNKLKDKLNVKGLLKGKKDKISKSVKSTKSKVKGSKPKGRGISPGVAGAIGGSAVLGASELMNQSSKRATEAELAAIKKQLEKLQKERDDRIDKDVEKYVKDRKNPEGINKDLTIDKSKEKKEVKPETKTEVKPETKTEVKPETKTETKPTNPSGKVIPKPKKPLSDKSPAAKAGIPKERRQKFANQNAAFQATKNKDSGYNKMDFIKDFPQSQTAKKFNKGERIPGFSYKKNLKNSYEPYDLVLDYVLSEGHADNIEEAHYVMMQLDEETIKEFIKKAALIGTGGYLAYKGLKTAGDKFNNYLNDLRNNSKLGGNRRVDDVRKNSGDPNVGQKYNFGQGK